jgi:uncharacterized protein (UPF0216 family)
MSKKAAFLVKKVKKMSERRVKVSGKNKISYIQQIYEKNKKINKRELGMYKKKLKGKISNLV